MELLIYQTDAFLMHLEVGGHRELVFEIMRKGLNKVAVNFGIQGGNVSVNM